MNTPQTATVRQLHALVSSPNPSPAASSAWRLLLTMHGPHATLDEMDNGREIRIPREELIYYVRRELALAEYYKKPSSPVRLSPVRLMRAMILDCLKNRYPREGKGNRARHRIEALNTGARRKCRVPAAPVSSLHLICA